MVSTYFHLRRNVLLARGSTSEVYPPPPLPIPTPFRFRQWSPPVQVSARAVVPMPHGGETGRRGFFDTSEPPTSIRSMFTGLPGALCPRSPPPLSPPTPPPSGNSATRPHAPDALLVRLFGLHRAVKPGRRGYWGMSVSLASTTGRTVVIFPPVTPRRGGRRKGIGETLVATSKGASSWICFPEDVSLAPLAGGGVFF